MNLEAKLLEANKLVKEEVADMSKKGSWKYIDFVLENRFMHEIKRDGFDVENYTASEIAEYAINQIYG